MANITAVCTSPEKGQRKTNIGKCFLIKNRGLENDAHAGFAHRQVSLLAEESIAKMIEKGLEVGPGDFAENLTTRGINLPGLPVGTRLRIGKEVILKISQIGKECHDRCAIYYQAGDCVMPREGVFAEVLTDGEVEAGDPILIMPSYRFGIITASDKGSRGEREDTSGPLISEMLTPYGDLADSLIVADDIDSLKEALSSMLKTDPDAIFTTGGTGMGPRDVTPEATLAIIERQVPGIPEAMRRETAAVTARAMLSRAVAGIAGTTLIVNLPGSPKAVGECLEVLLPVLEHALETVTGKSGDCAR